MSDVAPDPWDVHFRETGHSCGQVNDWFYCSRVTTPGRDKAAPPPLLRETGRFSLAGVVSSR